MRAFAIGARWPLVSAILPIVFPKLAFVTLLLPLSWSSGRLLPGYGTCKTPHSGAGRSERKDVPRLLHANDRPSRPGVQRPLRQNSTAAPNTAVHPAISLSFHLLGMGRDGRGHSQSGFQKGPQLHVRRIFGQV